MEPASRLPSSPLCYLILIEAVGVLPRLYDLVVIPSAERALTKELFISPHTVDTRRANICAKLELRGSHKLLEFALTHRSEL